MRLEYENHNWDYLNFRIVDGAEPPCQPKCISILPVIVGVFRALFAEHCSFVPQSFVTALRQSARQKFMISSTVSGNRMDFTNNNLHDSVDRTKLKTFFFFFLLNSTLPTGKAPLIDGTGFPE